MEELNMKRIIDCRSSDFEKMTRSELLDSIANCEGRTVCCETVGVFQPMLGDVTNAEFAAAMGADLLYEIEFETVGRKKLMASYARLKRE
jgi:hypothetical protein